MRKIKALISFYTIIPLKEHDMEGAAEVAHFSPLVIGIIVGGLAGIVGMVLTQILPPCTLCVIVFSILLLLTGFSHIDGLMDVADALMFKGSREERLKVLHDKYSGSAAVITVFIVEMISLTSLLTLLPYNLTIMIPLLIVVEVLARIPHILLAYMGPPPNYRGLGSIFVSKLYRNRNKILKSLSATLVTLAILAFLIGIVIKLIIALILLMITTILFRMLIVKNIGFMTGDCLGASIEISRAIALISLSTNIPIH